MGGVFQVDLDVLQQFISSLGQSGDHMDTALNALKSLDAGQIGTDELTEAASDFQDTWRYGLGQLKDKIKGTNDGVKAAHDAYRETDDEATKALERLFQAAAGGQ